MGWLQQLRTTVESFAARENDLNQEFQIRRSRERQRHDQNLAQLGTTTAANEAAAETAAAAARSQLEERHRRRKTWISRARTTSKEQGIARVDGILGAKKFQLQKRMLQAERERDADLAQNGVTHADFLTGLAHEQETMATLDQAAHAAFRGYGKFLQLLAPAEPAAGETAPGEPGALLEQLRQQLAQLQADLDQFNRRLLPRLAKFTPLWVILAVLPLSVVAGAAAFHLATSTLIWQAATAGTVAGLVLVLALYFVGRAGATDLARRIASALANSRNLHARCLSRNEADFRQRETGIREKFQKVSHQIDEELKAALETAADQRVACRIRADEKTLRAGGTCERLFREQSARLERQTTEVLASLRLTTDSQAQELQTATGANDTRLRSELDSRWQSLAAEWTIALRPLYESFTAARAEANRQFPPWNATSWANWSPPKTFGNAAPFGHLEVDVALLAGALPKDPRLALPGPARFTLPLLLTYPDSGSLLLESPGPRREEMAGMLNNVVLRLLSVTAPGRCQFTIIDPIGLGQSFAGVMHLADHAEQLINHRIWTQTAQIEEKLAELNEHMEKVIQMYLRNEYPTIAEYNAQAGDIAEKYHFLVVADFPANFSETAARRLLSIAASGARCGVYTLIHWDRRQPCPQDFVPDELRATSVAVGWKGNEFLLTGQWLPGLTLVPEAPPAADAATEFIHRVGRASKDSGRVQVPFSQVAPAAAEMWTGQTALELRVAIGRTGATKLQYLAMGKGTRQHGLIAGKTGSGKSTLFHVIITNLALWCSPEQVEFYLVDFKKGVEFKCYGAKRLPHARVVAIESDREFGLSVLQRLDGELKRRGDLFRDLGVQDIAGYQRSGGSPPLPRSLLLIDEFQEFFVEDDKISQSASVLLDRIVRQGRAFGIHVLLGSQTLGGAYTVARTTMGQMVIRIALQCNEADSYLIMDENNPAPRLLSRPGEGLYNDAAGDMAGNSPFQTVWLSDEVRDQYLDLVSAKARASGVAYPGPLVYEGDAPAEAGENPLLTQLLAHPVTAPALAPRIWLGAPNSIKGPTEAIFHRQSGNNLLLVGQRDDAALAILSLALIALAAQYPPGTARFILVHGSPPGSPARDYLEKIIALLPHPVLVPKSGDLGGLLQSLVGELQQQAAAESMATPPATFLFFHGMQRYAKLRYEEDFGFAAPDAEAGPNPATLLNQLICEGPTHGFHVLATFDTYNNVNRFLSKKAFGEFEMRVVFQMSANDSASLIDNPRANMLGLNRALFYNEQEGYLEVFRPYALPEQAWLQAHLRPAAPPPTSTTP